MKHINDGSQPCNFYDRLKNRHAVNTSGRNLLGTVRNCIVRMTIATDTMSQKNILPSLTVITPHERTSLSQYDVTLDNCRWDVNNL
jgi:hypothetical protein